MYANENKIKFDTHLGLENAWTGYLEIRLELDLTVVMG